MRYFIEVDKDGNKCYYKDAEFKILHRENDPAIECADGSKEWYINDKLHREDGPAIECANGDKFWYINDKRHREDGPAIEWANGSKRWYLKGEKLTEAEFKSRMKKRSERELVGYVIKYAPGMWESDSDRTYGSITCDKEQRVLCNQLSNAKFILHEVNAALAKCNSKAKPKIVAIYKKTKISWR